MKGKGRKGKDKWKEKENIDSERKGKDWCGKKRKCVKGKENESSNRERKGKEW